MPRQNRVNPFGEILSAQERGLFMGNRGVLHDDKGRIRRSWQVKRWLLCVLEFRERWRSVMTPGHYTELFFLDEVTGLAAGHRPCFECRRTRFLDFRDAWRAGNPPKRGEKTLTAAVMDNRLHAERLQPDGTKRFFEANLDELPDGVLVTSDRLHGCAWLLWKKGLLAWTPGGYAERRRRPRGLQVSVLTPSSTVGAIRAGYQPDVHPSVSRFAGG
jgi:hypothetical protein